MNCPICGSQDTKVIDSRLTDGNKIRRRRECLKSTCGERFTTFETAEISIPTVVKQNGNRESFDPEKLRSGLIRACEKRPVSADSISALIAKVEAKMRAFGEREVPSKQIGQWVMEGLRSLDDVAYIRFASVYLSFEDAAAFQKTINELTGRPAKTAG